MERRVRLKCDDDVSREDRKRDSDLDVAIERL